MLVRPDRGRRTVLKGVAALAFAGFAAPIAFGARRLFDAIGITAKVDRAAELKALGADFIVESVSDFLILLQAMPGSRRTVGAHSRRRCASAAATVFCATRASSASARRPITRAYSATRKRRSHV
jgi:hypothetical protein